MANKIQVLRGLQSNLPTLDIGEIAYTTDTERLYMGGTGGNVLINASLLTLSGIADNMEEIEFGTDGPVISFDEAQTPDTLVIGLDDTVSNTLLIIEKNNIGQDYSHPQKAHPTLIIHSTTDAGVATDQHLSLYHNTTDGVLETGLGSIKLAAAANKLDLDDHTLINTGSAPIRLGKDEAPTIITNAGDIYIGEDLEVAGTVYFRGSVSGIDTSGGSFSDDEVLYFGDGSDTGIVFSTFQTQDALWIGVSEATRHLHIGDLTDRSTDFGLSSESNPTLFIHSANQAGLTEYLKLQHDQTNALITTGTGSLKLRPANNIVEIGSTNTALKSNVGRIELRNSTDSGYVSMWLYSINIASAYGLMGTLTVLSGSDDGVRWGVVDTEGTSNNNFIFTRNSNVNKDHDHDTASANPTIFVHSNTDPDTDNTQWLSFAHDQTDGVIEAGKGAVKVNSSSQGLIVPRLSGDPAGGTNGEIYYNTTTNKFRGYENGAWANLI